MKCHNWVGATLTLKNLAMGFILDPDRDPRHTGFVCHNYENINRSIARLAQVIVPNLAVADGVIGMEGDGPGKGTPIESGIALAGTNALAVDLIGARLMGFDPRTIGYLWYLSKLKNLSPEQIQVVGEDVSQCITKYKAPNNYPKVLGWWVENWRESVEGDYRIPSE